ncbi:DUF1700 domain-containing protein [Lactiplantibacillus daowaiensis]|uniref:DUF1700 domain-containing protein n=1 Tax=Lactiplantibacillus daowaiensis TaxID=2559918 RepID=A0ABW1S1J3_9LACO|nr:DUF1700 domain-containing protein [Lactiplantibacillus daowaiensis]
MTDYLDKFAALLVQLQANERDEVLAFYREYLLDANIQTYEACVAELGTPKQLTRKILADYSIRFNETIGEHPTKHQKSRANMRAIWLIGLALLSTPITIPVALAILAMMAALAILVFAIVIAIIAIIAAITMTALAGLTAGVGVITQSLWTGCFYIGAGLAIIGGELLVFPLVIWFFNLMIQGVATIAQRLYHRFVKRNRAEREGRHHEKNH